MLLFLCSSDSNIRVEVWGPWRAPCKLKIPFKGRRPKLGICWEELKRKDFPRCWFIDSMMNFAYLTPIACTLADSCFGEKNQLRTCCLHTDITTTIFWASSLLPFFATHFSSQWYFPWIGSKERVCIMYAYRLRRYGTNERQHEDEELALCKKNYTQKKINLNTTFLPWPS